MIKQLIGDEKLVNIQKAQAGLTKLLLEAEKSGHFYRVIKNDQSLGVLVPQSMWESFVEDIEALSSPNYLSRISEARAEKKTVKAAELKKQLGIK